MAEKEKFNLRSSKYDEKTRKELQKLFPLTLPKPTEPPVDGVNEISNEGSFDAWVWHPELNEWKVHGGSIDPRTNMVLKGTNHPSFNKTKESEYERGNEFFERDGRLFTRKQLMGPPKPSSTKMMGGYPSRSTYKGDGGLMRLTGGILPWQYSSDSRDMDHKRAGDPVSAATLSPEELERIRQIEFERDVD